MTIKKSDISTAIAETDNSTFVIGEQIYFRLITYHGLGKITRISTCGAVTFLHLSGASWIPDTERFELFLKKGKLKECEPIPEEFRISVNAIVDVAVWNHPLPAKQI